MPVDSGLLLEALQKAIAPYRVNAETAVRSGAFIEPIHDYCARELSRQGLPEKYLVPALGVGGYLADSAKAALEIVRRKVRGTLRAREHAALRDALLADLDGIEQGLRKASLRILGAYTEKQIDVCLMLEDTGPLLAISVKSQMSSISKNFISRFEEYVGDATNLHERYPMLALGFMLVIPVTDETFDRETNQPKELLVRIHSLLDQATRRSSGGGPGSYDASALLVVDFDAETPIVCNSFPPGDSPLRIEAFFDRIVAAYRDQNRMGIG